MTPAFRQALTAAGVPDVQASGRRVRFALWEPPGVTGRLGPVDVLVGVEPNYRAFYELKWAASKRELGLTLWDIYKLATGRIEYGVSAYPVVGAPVSYWHDDGVACSALYCDSTWDSRQLFCRYKRAWADLLTGSTARPHRLPAAISTRLIAAQPLDTEPPWELRALRVEIADTEFLDFVDGWPVSA